MSSNPNLQKHPERVLSTRSTQADGAESSPRGEISLTVLMWPSYSSPAAGASLQLTSNFAAWGGETDTLLPRADSHFFYPPTGAAASFILAVIRSLVTHSLPTVAPSHVELL